MAVYGARESWPRHRTLARPVFFAHFRCQDVADGLDELSNIPRSRQGKSAPGVYGIGEATIAFRAEFQPDVRATVCTTGQASIDGKLTVGIAEA